ncbi:MspA family porin [Mycolicibacterium tokaiense]|uniref:MspA protein n=1 Tax=Mycolicibacterium tokaiense TaxID=39695 RepID=A0A378TDE4_9MYCO|nr:MspA family porin [Mycolicibacterium tokaiense]BBY86844.1 hypothetical protein MTOK_26260 [Mycolicibacterium tokaiense]STZ58650.1 MspA protein [Mycolicibacterium tokaiense]
MRTALAAAVLLCLGLCTAPGARAEPVADVAPVADVVPPPPNGAVASDPPGFVVTPDGWELTVGAQDETQVAVAPLTTAASSREYLVGGTFTGAVAGNGTAPVEGGTLEVGYQIGCGIELNVVKLNGSVGFQPSVGPTGLGNTNIPVTGQMEVFPQPGEVITSTVTTKSFEGAAPRVTLKDIHIKIDGCIGQSFLRSYAILTSSTETADDIVAYYGVAKVV